MALRLEVCHCVIEVSHRHLFTKNSVNPRKVLAGFVVDRSASGAGYSPGTSVSPCNYLPTNTVSISYVKFLFGGSNVIFLFSIQELARENGGSI